MMWWNPGNPEPEPRVCSCGELIPEGKWYRVLNESTGRRLECEQCQPDPDALYRLPKEAS